MFLFINYYPIITRGGYKNLHSRTKVHLMFHPHSDYTSPSFDQESKMFDGHRFITVDVMGTGHLEPVYYSLGFSGVGNAYDRIAKLLQCEVSEVLLYDCTGASFKFPDFPKFARTVVAFAYDPEPVTDETDNGLVPATYTALIVAERRLREFHFENETGLYTRLAKVLKRENYRNVQLVKPNGKVMQFKKNRKCIQYDNWPFYLAIPKAA